ncbi:MAG: hypothetical protein FWG89_07430 [Treponema sp.]|nr:hypothetical protein [Treponema sp.]
MTCEVDGHPALGFDTGLDARAFAQAKFSQSITEPGYIVNVKHTLLDSAQDSVQLWKASGVIEYARDASAGQPTMMIWGPPFEGERLDMLLNGPQDAALSAIINWMYAIRILEKLSPAALSGDAVFWPCTAIVQSEAVFFAPPGLTVRRISTNETTSLSGGKWYVHPDLDGMNAAVFTASAMLYRVFSGAPPFPATDEITLHQDMRESNFLPVRFAVPGLNDRLSALMQSALMLRSPEQSGSGKSKNVTEAPSLNDFLAVLQPVDNKSLLISPLSDENRILVEKEKSRFLKVTKASVTTRRFVMRHATLIMCCFAAVAGIFLVVNSLSRSRASLPTTAGMEPVQVIESYYSAIGDLDHEMMDACVIKGVGRDDINMVTNLYVIGKVRQAYEYTVQPVIMSAAEWQQMGGGPVEAEVFGVTDLVIMGIEDGEWGMGDGDQLRYRVEYTLWVPAVFEDSEAQPGTPRSYQHSEELTLVQRNGNWRISQIKRN